MNMKNLIGNLVFVAILLLIIARFATIFNGANFPINVVASSSMEPTLKKGDIVIWIPANIESVRKGDIVVYKSIYGNLIIHRVTEIKDGKLITKGDASNYTDQAGPHVPEPMVSSKNFLGKAIMIGQRPLKIPFIGNFWLLIHRLAGELAKPMKYGEVSPMRFMIFLPFVFSLSVFLLLLILWIPNGKSLKEKLHQLIFGPDKISLKNTLYYSLSFFIPFLLLVSFFAYDCKPLGENKEYPVFNPSWLKIKGIAFIEGNKNASIMEKIFTLKSGEVKKLSILGDKGSGKIFIYSSPYWILISDDIISYFYSINPKICILFSSLIASLIMAFITFFLLLFTSFIIEKLFLSAAYIPTLTMKHYQKFLQFYKIGGKIKSKINILGRRIRYMLMWIEKNNKKAFFASFITLFFVPFLFDGINNLFLVALLSSITISIFIYILGGRFKNDIALASLVSSSIISLLFTLRIFYALDGLSFITILQYISISFILLLFIFAFQFIIALINMMIIHEIRERINPAAMLEVCDI